MALIEVRRILGFTLSPFCGLLLLLDLYWGEGGLGLLRGGWFAICSDGLEEVLFSLLYMIGGLLSVKVFGEFIFVIIIIFV